LSFISKPPCAFRASTGKSLPSPFFIFWILHGLKFWIQKHLEIKIRMSLINVFLILCVSPFLL
jgi:hypothetical protein